MNFLQQALYGVHVFFIDSHHKADTHVEYIAHFIHRNISIFRNHIKDRLVRISCCINGNTLSFLQHSRHIFIEAASGDVTHSLDINLA